MIERDLTFPTLKPLPLGYRVVQLDSGHFLGIGPERNGKPNETSINVDRWAVRRWCFEDARLGVPRERPILWSAPMVLALLAGRKTQTRRIARFEFREGQNPNFSGYTPGTYCTGVPSTGYVLRSRGDGGCWNDRTKPLKPYASAGDRLWGRETWSIAHERSDIAWDIAVAQAQQKRNDCGVVYRADANGGWAMSHLVGDKWRPSIFMPRWASRLLHEVTAVRVERLGDISEEDAIAEGLKVDTPDDGLIYSFGNGEWFNTAREAYLAGWDTINGKGSAAKNPWTWVVSFKPVTP